MDVFEAIQRRHSYRGPFRDEPVAREDLQRIVQAGIQAPSGRNMQTTSFVIVDDPGMVKRLNGMPGGNQAMREAQAYIVCVMDRRPDAIYEGHAFQVEDCAAAVENMLLAVTALGYASVWIDGWLRVEGRADEIRRMLSIPEEKLVRIILPVGIPVEEHTQKEKQTFEERAWFNRYGGAK
jgi:nitroreductase